VDADRRSDRHGALTMSEHHHADGTKFHYTHIDHYRITTANGYAAIGRPWGMYGHIVLAGGEITTPEVLRMRGFTVDIITKEN